MEFLLDPNIWIAFAMLTTLEIVLAAWTISSSSPFWSDVCRLSGATKARRLGLGFAMISRLLLLASLSWIMGLKADLFSVFDQGVSQWARHRAAGGWPVPALEGFARNLRRGRAREQDHAPETDAATLGTAGQRLFWGIIGQIAIIDIVFSLDSVITAVGMVDNLAVMVAAVVAAVGVMMFAAKADPATSSMPPFGQRCWRWPSW